MFQAPSGRIFGDAPVPRPAWVNAAYSQTGTGCRKTESDRKYILALVVNTERSVLTSTGRLKNQGSLSVGEGEIIPVWLIIKLSFDQWRQSKFILRGRNFFPQREGDEAGWVVGERQRDPPHQLGGLGECCGLPQRGPGWSPGKFEIWCNLRPKNSLQKCLIMFKLLQKG